MRITEIRVSLRDEDKLKAFVTVTLNDCFVLRGLRIIRGSRGMFVAMPSRRKPDGTYQDLCHPIDLPTRRWMEDEILAHYRAQVERGALVE